MGILCLCAVLRFHRVYYDSTVATFGDVAHSGELAEVTAFDGAGLVCELADLVCCGLALAFKCEVGFD